MIDVELTARAYELVREGVTIKSRKGGVYKVLMPKGLAAKLHVTRPLVAVENTRAISKQSMIHNR